MVFARRQTRRSGQVRDNEVTVDGRLGAGGQLNIRDVEMPDKDAVAVEPPQDERRRAGRAGSKPASAKATGPKKDSKKFSDRKNGERRSETSDRKFAKAGPNAKRQENAAPAPKRDPNAPVWNPIRARVDSAEDVDRERFAREETVRPNPLPPWPSLLLLEIS